MEESLKATAVSTALKTRWLGRNYHYLAVVGSTNDLLKQWADDKNRYLPPGALILADFQTAGRGRLERRWKAPPGTALLFSVLLRPRWPEERLSWIIMLAGLAIAEAIEEITGLTARLKWPNDVVIDLDGRWHKVCGLLVEGNIEPADRLAQIILGIGVNVNIPADQLPAATTPATSLLAATGRPVARLALLAKILERLEQHYEAAENGRSPQPAWTARLVTIGQPVTVTRLDHGRTAVVEGVAEGANGWGHLLVRDAAGALHTVTAGDVTLHPHQSRCYEPAPSR